MTIEFWPRSLRTPKPAKKPPKKRKPRRPKLPVKVGKAHQMLTTAIMLGDHELASWIDGAVKTDRVIGKPSDVEHLRERLDAVMEPLPA
jgi:hypothetical protein